MLLVTYLKFASFATQKGKTMYFLKDLDTFVYFNHFLNGLNRPLARQNKSIIILEVFKCLPELILVNELESKSRCTIRSESFVF